MPQTERAAVLKKLLKWLAEQEKGATLQAIIAYTKWEITEGGATDNTSKKYVEDLGQAVLIEYAHPFWRVTKKGREWLERHSV